ncbi:MAG: diacylglycerol kinase family lipid kinase [Deltaproteobacteria bacterium]|nr:diacylglycerol kinase family lipid kinase [Deltaproteobacteria bacterium]
MKARFIINPTAGPKRGRIVERVSAAAREVFLGGQGLFDIKVSERKGAVAELAKDAARLGFDFVFVSGGDGTVNEAASILVGTGTALGIIPMGSGNGLAGALGITGDVKKAVGLLKEGRVREIDAGCACGRYFFSTAAFALEARLSMAYDRGFIARRIRGVLPYAPIALIEYMRYRPPLVKVSADNESFELVPLILTAANADRYGKGAYIAPGASLDDGLLDFCAAPRVNLWRSLALARRIVFGGVERSKDLRRIPARHIRLSGAGEWTVELDGEPFIWKGEVEIRVMEKRLKVLAP